MAGLLDDLVFRHNFALATTRTTLDAARHCLQLSRPVILETPLLDSWTMATHDVRRCPDL